MRLISISLFEQQYFRAFQCMRVCVFWIYIIIIRYSLVCFWSEQRGIRLTLTQPPPHPSSFPKRKSITKRRWASASRIAKHTPVGQDYIVSFRAMDSKTYDRVCAIITTHKTQMKNMLSILFLLTNEAPWRHLGDFDSRGFSWQSYRWPVSECNHLTVIQSE